MDGGNPTEDPELHSRQLTSPVNIPDYISWPSQSTKQRMEDDSQDDRRTKIAKAVRTILEAVGEDPDREGLAKTPLRYANALLYFTQGYEQNLPGRMQGIYL